MRRDLNELAQMLFPDPEDVVREGLGGTLPPTYEGGVALSDSADGEVRVLPDGTVTTWADGDPDGTAEDASDPDAQDPEPVTVPCTANIREGDRVLLVAQDGAYVDCMAAGSGDRVAATASNAEAIATATNQHFWSDTNGIHVSTDEGDAEGANNILINSLGILLRELQTVLLELSSAGVIVGDQSGTHLAIDNNSVDVVDSGGNELLTMGADSNGFAQILAPVPSGKNHGNVRIMSESGIGSFLGNAQLYASGSKVSTIASNAIIAAYSPINGSNKDAIIELFSDADGSTARVEVTAKSILVNSSAPIVYEDKTVTVPSTAAGSNYSSSAISVLKTGYSPIGCYQTWWASGTNQNKFNDYGTHVEAGNLYVRLHNYGTAAASGSLKCRILYVKLELL